MSRKCKFFASFICLLLSLVLFTGCAQLTETPEQIAKTAADQAAQEVLGKLIWGEADRTAITSDVTFITSNKNYPGVSIEWSSSQEDVISTEGKVARPSYNDERAVMVGEDRVVKVVITAKVTATYSWGPEGAQKTATTEPISKQFNFSVLTLADGIDSGTIKDVKARAWDYIYVQQGVDKALVSNSNVVYNVLLKGKVTAKLQAAGATKGFFMHDGTEGIYVYGDNSANVGDTVEVIGEIYSYYGNLQVGSNITVNVIADEGYELPEHQATTPQQWEDKTKGLGDDVIGRLGGDLLKVSGYLTEKTPTAGSDKYCLVDAETGEESWLYYKAYTPEMEEVLKSYVGKYVDLYGVSYDRDSRIQKNEICWTGEIVETEAPKVDDESKVQVALKQINLEESYKEDFDLNPAGVWEVVSGTGIEIVDGVAKVTQGDADQEVVLKVTVTIGEASASKEFKVVVKGIVKETVKHAGTKEDPYSVSDAVLVAGELAVGGLTNTVYAIGQIVSIKELSTSYGNATFNISDGKNEIIVYRAKFLNNEKFTSEDQIKVGDVVVICGQLTNYNGTLEFNSGCYIDSFGELVEEGPFKVNTPYYFALEQANLGKTLYLTGEMNGFYYAVTENTAEAAKVIVEQAEGGYNLKVVKVDGSVVYMDIVASGTHINVVFVETPTAPFAYNEEFDTFTKEVEGLVRYIGTYGTYTTMSPSSIDKAATSFVAHLYDIEGEQPEPKHEHVACPECGKCTADDCDGTEEEKCAGHEIVTPTQGLKEGQAYRFTLVQPKAGKTVYFTGKMSSYYYATSTDINAGVDVFVEYVEGGLNLYFVDANGAKHYMGMAASGTHINAVFDQDKTVFTYNEELQTVVGLVDGKEYVFGTRNDNTYTTIGANALSYAPFMVTFVPVGGEAPHEHNFVEGKCECGEVDPNYVPAHKHEICPECGKCLLEDCDGEKCTGHESQPETEAKAELTVNSLGIKDQTYAAGVANVNGVDFEFIQIGNYGNGIQMRDKNGNTSQLWNTSAFGKGIVKIELVYSSTMAVQYANANAVIFQFGNGVGSYSYETKLSTTAGVKNYTITPDAETYTFFRLEHDLGYTLYWDSITIYFANGEVVTPHVHEGGKATCKQQAICTSCGEAYGELADHVWDDRGYSYNDEKHWVDCVVCQAAKNNEANHDFSNGNCVCGKEAPVTPTQGLKEGQAYRFTLVQPKAGKTVYFTGKMSSYYYATSTDINAGVDVFVEYVEGGLNLYFVDANGAKHYMGMAVSGTHINAVFDQDKTVFTYNEELQTVVGLVDGKEYVFGTRNDNTYTTIGANALSYAPFMVTFVPVGGEAPHEHNFVEGKCECGEVDPNYVPPHVHEECPECGKCLAEDCEGEKCEGHEVEPEVAGGKADLETIKTSMAQGDSSYTKTFTTEAGWVSVNAAIQTGHTTNINPQFTVIGPDMTYKAVCLNGKVSAPGSLTSPTLSGGISKLTFNWAKVFSDTKIKFTVTITDLATGTAYEYVVDRTFADSKDGQHVLQTEEFVLETPITGDFTIQFVNNAPSAATSNKDRATIFNIAWVGAPAVHEHKGGQATCSELAKCAECGEEYGELAEHVDTNLDITCDFEGCTKRILPAADSKVSLFTANHMTIVSLSSNYYVEGVITEITDAKNGIFIIADEEGNSILVRLPKNAEGVSYASWTDLKVVVGDTVQLYGKPAKNSSAPTTEKAKIEAGVLTVLKHEHKFSEATCTEPSICACLTINEQALGHADDNANKICDRCQFDLTLKIENIVVATDTTLSNGVIDEAKTFWTWAGTDFDVVIAKGESTFTLYTTAKAYMQLKKQNTISVLNKTNSIIQTITVYVTNATQLGYLKAAFAGLNFVENTENLNLVITWNSAEDFVQSNVGTSTVYISGVEVLYKPATEEPAPHVHNFVEGKCECGEEDPNYIPPHAHVACETCGLCVAEDCDGAEEVKCAGHEAASAVTVTFVVADVASVQGWGSSSNCLKEAYAIDENVSISVAGGANSGKCYTDHLRIYATDTPAGSITLTAAEGYKIQSVSFGLVTGTYAFLQFDGATVQNGQVVEIDAASAVFNTVKNGSNGKQVRLLSVTITYVAA